MKKTKKEYEMENNLIKINYNEITFDNEGLKEIEEACQRMADRLNSQAVTSENYKDFEDIKKESKGFLKELSEKTDSMKKLILEPFKQVFDTIEESSALLKEAIKSHEAKCLEEKKNEFKQKCKDKIFVPLMEMADDGEVIDFEDVYEYSWYGNTEKKVQSLMIAKIKKIKSKGELCSYKITCYRDVWEQIKTATKGLSYNYREVDE